MWWVIKYPPPPTHTQTQTDATHIFVVCRVCFQKCTKIQHWINVGWTPATLAHQFAGTRPSVVWAQKCTKPSTGSMLGDWLRRWPIAYPSLIRHWATKGWWLAPLPFTPEFGVWFPVSAVWKNISSPSTCKTYYCGEPPWPRGSVLGLRLPTLNKHWQGQRFLLLAGMHWTSGFH